MWKVMSLKPEIAILCTMANKNTHTQLTNVQSTKSEAAVTVRKKSVSCFTPTRVNTLKTC